MLQGGSEGEMVVAVTHKEDTGYPREDSPSNWEVEWEVKKRDSKSAFEEVLQGWVKGTFF